MLLPLPKLYSYFSDKDLFTFSEAKDVDKNSKLTKERLQQMRQHGYIIRVRRGLYRVVPIKYIGREKLPRVDKILLASKVVSPYCLSYHTALEVHGVARSPLFSLVLIASPNQFRPFSYESILYTWMSRKNLFGVEKVLWSNDEIIVTDRERTLVDCIRRPNLAGGLEETIMSLMEFPSVDIERVLDYLNRLGIASVFHRVGYFLSRKKVRERWDIKDIHLRKLKKKLRKRFYYFGPITGKPQLVKDWNIIVPAQTQELFEDA